MARSIQYIQTFLLIVLRLLQGLEHYLKKDLHFLYDNSSNMWDLLKSAKSSIP